MERQTRFNLNACLRAVGFTSLVVGILVLLYQTLVYLKLGAWQSIGIGDAIHSLGWDEVYWIPSAMNWPMLHKLMTLFLKVPVWILGILFWGIIRLLIGSSKKDETI